MSGQCSGQETSFALASIRMARTEEQILLANVRRETQVAIDMNTEFAVRAALAAASFFIIGIFIVAFLPAFGF